jgi:rhodanese-related sulfurtransferase
MRAVAGAVLALLAAWPCLAQELRVAIRDNLPYLDVVHEGRKVRIQRIQDTQHRLTDNWARTSRPCPPACIQPMVPAPGVQPVGELELLDFLQGPVASGAGFLVDARPPELYRVETIPTAVNVPAHVLRKDNPHIDSILVALGGRKEAGRWDFARAADVLLFGNGAWSDDAAEAVRALLALGYPPPRIQYFRGGLHAWRSFGLTTIVPARSP